MHNIFNNNNFIDLSIYQYGYEECKPQHLFGPAKRNHFLFHYIVSGKGQVMSTDNKGHTHTHHLKENQGFMIWPDQSNTYLADTHDPWVYMWIEFDGLKARELVTLAGFSPCEPIYNGQNTEMRKKLKETMSTIVHGTKYSDLEKIGHLYIFADALINSSSFDKTVQRGNLQDFYVREAITFIEQNYQDDITIEEIAEYCNLDRSYFGKIFKDKLNATPQEFLTQYRMTKACELLKISDHLISDISTLVGYENPTTFSRAFKRFYNVSPRKWRSINQMHITR